MKMFVEKEYTFLDAKIITETIKPKRLQITLKLGIAIKTNKMVS